jgi:hypothetical protein
MDKILTIFSSRFDLDFLDYNNPALVICILLAKVTQGCQLQLIMSLTS